jgi:hypothetical protein
MQWLQSPEYHQASGNIRYKPGQQRFVKQTLHGKFVLLHFKHTTDSFDLKFRSTSIYGQQ